MSQPLLASLEQAVKDTPFFQSLVYPIYEHFEAWKLQETPIQAFQSSPCSYIFIQSPQPLDLLKSDLPSDGIVGVHSSPTLFQAILLFPQETLPPKAQSLLATASALIDPPSASNPMFHFLTGHSWLLSLPIGLFGASLSSLVQSLDNIGFIVEKTNRCDNSGLLLASLTARDLFSGSDGSSLLSVRSLLASLLTQSLQSHTEIPRLARLILLQGLSLRQIQILLAQISYLIQLQFPLSRESLQDCLLRDHPIAAAIVHFFEARLNPSIDPIARKALADSFELQILHSLKAVSSIASDRLFRKLLQLNKALTRTNYYQLTATGQPKDYLSFKLNPHLLTDVPPPVMFAEIFVYHSSVEGVHLRTSKVARGGIRWSDRFEDYRTEVLGLVKAQQVKNTLIVPSGAKGGFFLKDSLFASRSREDQQTIARQGYRLFISGLLDLTDCDPSKDFPLNTLCLDPRDPYLVVAADKGTATFSDLANQISKEYNHWLQDAFASGGSQGYDHKKIGITAKGAFLSAGHHARNLGLSQEGTMVGIGDLSGDVFGNGAILWPHLKLVAAFNHQHIFIDPSPTPAAYIERLRMTKLEKSSWMDYDTSTLSPGGFIVDRSQKEILLSPQAQALLGTDLSSMSPDQLLTAILLLPVDILLNGGIGTYVKASSERHSDVADKANDSIRVDSSSLRCKMIIEGGNMGVTQKGRVEFSRLGGAVNTDTVDNSGGVDCSDHEVNLKIFIDNLIDRGLFHHDRSLFLKSATNEVAALVLKHNLAQNQTISFMEHVAIRDRFLHQRILRSLSESGLLSLEVEKFPPATELNQRFQSGQGLSRPELIVLFAYVKMDLKRQLLADSASREFCKEEFLSLAFPHSVVQAYKEHLPSHPLAQEIAITHLVNHCTQFTGISFYYRLAQETGASIKTLFQCTLQAMEIFKIPQKILEIEALESLAFAQRYEAILQIYRLLFRCTKWLALNPQDSITSWTPIAARVDKYQPSGINLLPLDRALSATQLFPALGLALQCQDQICDHSLFQSFEQLREGLQASIVEWKIESLPARNAWEAQARSFLREDFLKNLQTLAAIHREEKNILLSLSENFKSSWGSLLQALQQEDVADFSQLFVMIRFIERRAQGLSF